MEWGYSDYITIILAAIAIVFLLTIIFDYWKRDSGLKKGSVLVCFVALILVLMPNASDLIFKFGGNELVFKSSEQELLKQTQLAEKSKYIEKQNQVLSEKIDGIAESLRINGEILNAIHQNDQNDQATKEKLESLVQKQDTITKSIAKKLPKYTVAFENIEFNEVCEKLNSQGEFYYAFMVNGNRVVYRPLKDRIRKAKGEQESLVGSSIEVQKVWEKDTFRLTGFINEYDGESFWSKSLKITTVGEVSEEIPLKPATLKFSIGDPNNTICRASLNLSVSEV